MTMTASGSSSLAAVLNPVKPSIATTSTRLRQDSSRSASQALKACLERPSTMSSSRAGPVPSRMPVRSMITVTYLSPRLVWRHTCSSTPIAVTSSNRPGVVDEDALSLGQDGVVGGVPGDPEPFGDTGDSEVLADDGFKRPPQPAARELRPRLSRLGGVLSPHVPTGDAAVASDRDVKDRGPPAEWLVRQSPGHGVTRCAFATAAAAPLIGLDDPARENRTIRGVADR